MTSLRHRISKRVERFAAWWRTPPSRGDRFFGALVGAFGGFWVGVLLFLAFATPPLPLSTIGLGALGTALLGVALGLFYPKGTALLLFPFSILGIGSGS